MKILQFRLTMPNVNTWNGKWTGEGNQYIMFRTLKNEDAKILQLHTNRGREKNNLLLISGIDYSYDFGDGWRANVEVKIITNTQKYQLQKVSKGFCGYEWMIDSILTHSKIKS